MGIKRAKIDLSNNQEVKVVLWRMQKCLFTQVTSCVMDLYRKFTIKDNNYM